MLGSGLKEIFVSSGIVLEGTANKILSGKGYYQAINAHMRAHEALTKLWWQAFENFFLEKDLDQNSFVVLNEKIRELKDRLGTDDGNTLADLVAEIQVSVKDLRSDMDYYNNSRSQYKTHKFWLQYLGMLETLLLYIHAERDGVWSEHLSATAAMTPVITAADHQKYSKVLVTYLEEMRSLPENAPEIEKEFVNGNFTVKRSNGSFNNIWTDMALECSQNCDAKGRSGQAGLKGMTLSEKTQEKWFVTLPFSAAVSSSLKNMLRTEKTDIMHHDDNKSSMKKELDQREAIIEVVNTEMINPFTYEDCTEIVNICSGLKAPDYISDDLLTLEEKGKNALKSYLSTDKLGRVNLHTFLDIGESTKKAAKLKKYKNELTDELQIMKRALVEKERETADHVQFSNILSHELRRYPPSIAEMDNETGECYLRGGNKAILLEILKKRSGLENWPCNLPIREGNMKEAVVVDAMAVIRAFKPHGDENSELFAERILKDTFEKYPYAEIHIAADRYDGIFEIQDPNGRNICLKDSSGCRHRRKEAIKEFKIYKGMQLKHFEDIVHNNASKANLLAFLFETWSKSMDVLGVDTKLYLSGGFENRLQIAVIDFEGDCQISYMDRYLLTSTHEEADTRIFLHAVCAAQNGCSRIVIRATDTDIVVIALYLFERLRDIGVKELFVKMIDKCIPVHEIINRCDNPSLITMLPLFHALSGCDTTSYFYGKGKRAFFNATLETGHVEDLASICKHIETGDINGLVEFTLDTVKDIVVSMYAKDRRFSDLNSLRSHLYYASKKPLENLPPTDDAFRQHVLRVLNQTTLWIQADQPTPSIVDPYVFGWTYQSGKTKPLLMCESPIPSILERDYFCKCKKRCTRNCSCAKKEIRCESSCFCRGLPAYCARAQYEYEE